MSVDVNNLVDKSAKARIESRETKLPSDSIVRQVYLSLVEKISPPEIFIPRREYSQKFDIDEEEISPNLSLFMMYDSKKANEEWVNWIESLGTDDVIKLLLTEEEYTTYTEYEKELKEIEERNNDLERSLHNSIICSTPKFLSTKIPDLTASSSGRSIKELDLFKDQSYLEMIGRELKEKPFDPAFLNPIHDPDFVNPLSHGRVKQGGFLIQPVSRPYNLSFGIEYVDSSGNRKYTRSKPKTKKDYSTKEDIEYLLKSKGITDFKVTVLTHEDAVSWEYDLRISPLTKVVNEHCEEIDNLIPDPVNYRKIDNDSPIGRRLIKSLKDNPYHEWKEVSWMWGEEKKVALVRKNSKNELYWVYVSNKDISRSFGRTKVIWPQLIELTDASYESKARYLIGYQVRATDYKELDEPFGSLVKSKLTSIVSDILGKGFVFVSKSSHDDFGTIVYSFVRNDLKTAKQRYLERNS